jgi:hypothetical protein
VRAIVIVVMLAPKQMPAGSAPRNSPTTLRVDSRSASQASAAAKYPPVFAFEPVVAHSVIALIATSTICVPAGPSNRDQPSRKPGKWRRRDLLCAFCNFCESLCGFSNWLDVALIKIANLDAVRESNSVSQPVETVSEDYFSFGADGHAVKFNRRSHCVAHTQI